MMLNSRRAKTDGTIHLTIETIRQNPGILQSYSYSTIDSFHHLVPRSHKGMAKKIETNVAKIGQGLLD